MPHCANAILATGERAVNRSGQISTVYLLLAAKQAKSREQSTSNTSKTHAKHKIAQIGGLTNKKAVLSFDKHLKRANKPRNSVRKHFRKDRRAVQGIVYQTSSKLWSKMLLAVLPCLFTTHATRVDRLGSGLPTAETAITSNDNQRKQCDYRKQMAWAGQRQINAGQLPYQPHRSVLRPGRSRTEAIR